MKQALTFKGAFTEHSEHRLRAHSLWLKSVGTCKMLKFITYCFFTSFFGTALKEQRIQLPPTASVLVTGNIEEDKTGTPAAIEFTVLYPTQCTIYTYPA